MGECQLYRALRLGRVRRTADPACAGVNHDLRAGILIYGASDEEVPASGHTLRQFAAGAGRLSCAVQLSSPTRPKTGSMPKDFNSSANPATIR